MIDEKQAAVFSLWVYRQTADNEPIILPPWSEKERRTEGTSGFAYAVLHNSASNEVVIAFQKLGSDHN